MVSHHGQGPKAERHKKIWRKGLNQSCDTDSVPGIIRSTARSSTHIT